MLSRVADNLYWMSRYVERAEGVTRLVEVNRDTDLQFHASDNIFFNLSKLIMLSLEQ